MSARDAEVTAGQVVHFTWTDPILGGQLERVGLVLDVTGDSLTVAPLAGHALTVPAADAAPVKVPADVPDPAPAAAAATGQS